MAVSGESNHMRNWHISVVLLIGSLLRMDAAGPKAPHWAFQPVRDPASPRVVDTAWSRTRIDDFVLSRLEADHRKPAPPAARRALLRRATFDLTGLPPTAAETDAFVADPSPDAFAKVVDRLLGSSAYGERWGRHWLDVVRYADTAGETADYPVPVAWRYRNYVIDAFNADKPYDEFLREQIAGDILAKDGPRSRYAERVTATGFLAISRRFGFDSENYHHLTLQDTIDTLGQSVLGLTLGCARCHDHKFDPVPMRDYYALYGIFESTRYAFPGSEQKQRSRALVPLSPPEESRPKWRAFEARVASLVAVMERAKISPPSAVLRSLDEMDGDFEMQAPAAGGSKGVLVPPWVYDGAIAVTTEAQSPFKNLSPLGKVGASVAAGTGSYRLVQSLPAKLASLPGEKLEVNLDFRTEASPAGPEQPHVFWIGPLTAAATGAGHVIEVLISSESASLRIGDRSEPLRVLKPKEWHNLQLTIDPAAGTVSGRIGRPGDVTEIASRGLAADTARGLGCVGIEGPRPEASAHCALAWDNLGVQTAPIPPVSTPFAAVADGGIARAPADPAGLKAEGERARKELETLLAEGPFELAYAVSEGTPRDARIHLRGEPDRPGDTVPRGALAVLGGGPFASGNGAPTGSGRLELARWLTRPENPLTARVMVNRIWRYHFGEGLVRTPNDFGIRGRPPTHPELLDHLATSFVKSGWSIKAMHRLIMASAVYQQQSRSTAALGAPKAAGTTATDDCPVATSIPSSRSPTDGVAEGGGDDLSPFSRRRLGAEETRDAVLKVCGTLDPSPGLGHPFPAPTSWGFTQHGPFNAIYEHGRRSVYLMTQRIRRHPFLALFDGADPNASTAERRTTTVPTQALFFLNDPFVHANSRQLADRTLAAVADEPRQVVVVYRSVLGRDPDGTERNEGAEFLAAYRSGTTAAGKGDATAEALAALVRVLAGSNEFLTVD